MESLYEYGSRAGFWRLHRLFTAKGLPLTGACNPTCVFSGRRLVVLVYSCAADSLVPRCLYAEAGSAKALIACV